MRTRGRLAACENWSRPLTCPRSMLRQCCETTYRLSAAPWHCKALYARDAAWASRYRGADLARTPQALEPEPVPDDQLQRSPLSSRRGVGCTSLSARVSRGRSVSRSCWTNWFSAHRACRHLPYRTDGVHGEQEWAASNMAPTRWDCRADGGRPSAGSPGPVLAISPPTLLPAAPHITTVAVQDADISPATESLIWRAVCQVSSVHAPLVVAVAGLAEVCSGGEASGEVLSTSVSLIRGGWLPQVPGCVAGWRVSRTGRGLVRAAHSSSARASGLRGPAMDAVERDWARVAICRM